VWGDGGDADWDGRDESVVVHVVEGYKVDVFVTGTWVLVVTGAMWCRHACRFH
jgi:hypothetical protein